jgi:hypothetical protein
MITYHNLAQVFQHSLGIWHIASKGRRNLRKHRAAMNALFYGGCFTPALLRLPAFFNYPVPYWWNIIALVITFGFIFYANSL